MGPVIAEMSMRDYDDVIRLWQQAEGVGLSSADSRGSIRRYLRRNPRLSFVARDAGKIVGAVLCGHDGRRGYLHHLTVSAPYRRRGIGTALVRRCMDRLRAAGIQKCHLFLFAGNAQGRRFWKANGWAYRTDIGVMSLTLEGRT
jgi:putative acetyltransferase